MTKELYIVTGGTGFVGNNLVREIERQGKDVVVLARNLDKCNCSLKDCSAKITCGTIMSIECLEELFDGVGKDTKAIFIHTASYVYIGSNRKKIKHMFETNIDGTRNVINACLRHKARLVYISSVHAIPETPGGGVITEVGRFDAKWVVGHYAKSKAMASQMVLDAVRDENLDAVLVHPSGITGPNDFSDTHLTQMVDDYKNNRIPASVVGGYDFVDVRDVVSGTLAAAESGKTGECYLLTNRFYTVRQVLDTLHELGIGKKVKRNMPMWIARVGLPFLTLYFKILKKRPLYTRYSLYTLGSNSNFSHEKASTELGYNPRELKESLKDMI
ncbi:MAG: SDR family NAD(P)-dependent oxidoreductase [Firmicutes bacterium]|nr:SDR family NAD(P)-dependent oxidoreductase [Bacillota bacterium]